MHEGEREIWNNDTIDRLCQGVDLLFATPARFVKVLPTAPMVDPEGKTETTDETA